MCLCIGFAIGSCQPGHEQPERPASSAVGDWFAWSTFCFEPGSVQAARVLFIFMSLASAVGVQTLVSQVVNNESAWHGPIHIGPESWSVAIWRWHDRRWTAAWTGRSPRLCNVTSVAVLVESLKDQSVENSFQERNELFKHNLSNLHRKPKTCKLEL